MHIFCHMAAAHVTIVSSFAFWSEESFAKLPQQWAKIYLNCCVLVLFAGAWARHEGLRRLKPCQSQTTVYWHCECGKLLSDAWFQLLVVCHPWKRGHKAIEPCLTRFQLAIVTMEVSINDGSNWKTFNIIEAWSETCKKISNGNWR